MSLVKWQRPESLETSLARYEQSLAEARKVLHIETVPAYRPFRPTAPVIQQAPREFELPRFCARHDAAVMALYTLQPNGVYIYNQSYWLEDRHRVHYRAEDQYRLPQGFRPGAEQCACGAHTPVGRRGNVWCPQCSSWVCFGRTTPSDYFQCRDSCGNAGQIGTQPYQETFALTPRLRR